MEFVETLGFTRRITTLLNDTEYNALQHFLNAQPAAGDMIQGTSGARKLRWRKKGQGKRGGLRVIYFYHETRNTMWMLAVYEKTDKADLSPNDKSVIKRLIEEIKK